MTTASAFPVEDGFAPPGWHCADADLGPEGVGMVPPADSGHWAGFLALTAAGLILLLGTGIGHRAVGRSCPGRCAGCVAANDTQPAHPTCTALPQAIATRSCCWTCPAKRDLRLRRARGASSDMQKFVALQS